MRQLAICFYSQDLYILQFGTYNTLVMLWSKNTVWAKYYAGVGKL